MTSNEGSTRTGARFGAALGKVFRIAAGVVWLVGSAFALILVGHILLTLLDANPENAITRFFADLAGQLVLWFDGLFTPEEPKLALTVNYGLAAVFWLVAAGVVARILRAFG